jgi:hypothetical protein
MIPMRNLGTMRALLGLVLLLVIQGLAMVSAQDGTPPAAVPAPDAAAVAATVPASDAGAGTPYDQVMSEMSRFDERLPGSPGYEASLNRLTSVLEAAKIQVHRQLYNTLVPHTITCSLRYGEVALEDVHPLGPNGIALPSSWGHIISGPMCYLGDGSMAAMDGKSVRGCVAVLEMGSPNLGLVFSQGAKAVVLVGDDSVTQWQAETLFTNLPAVEPVVWLDHAHAAAAGLLIADGSKEGSLQLASSWQSVQATNLWAKLPATRPLATTDAERPLALVLAASIDTFGAIPERSPQLRAAANAALLAQVAVELAKGDLARPVYIVFLGSHYAAQDGCRNFYFPIGKVISEATGAASLESREKNLCLNNIAKIGRQQALVRDLSFVTEGQNNEAIELYGMATQYLVAAVDEINFHLFKDTTSRKTLDAELNLALKNGNKDQSGTIQSQLSGMDAAEIGYKSSKEMLNRLRKQLAEKHITNLDDFAQVANYVSQRLVSAKAFFDATLLQTRSMREIESAMKGGSTLPETIAAHFSFDFAAADAPWTFCPFGADAWSRSKDISVTTFSKQFKDYQQAVADLPASLSATARMWLPDDSISFRTDSLSTPHERSVACAAPMLYGIPSFQLVTLGNSLDQDEMPVRGSWQLQGLAPQLIATIRAIAGYNDLTPTCGLVVEPTLDEKLVIQSSGVDVAGLLSNDLALGSDGSDIKGPATMAVVSVSQLPTSLVGSEPRYLLSGPNCAFAAVDPTGHCFIPGIVELAGSAVEAQTEVFGFDEFGAIDRFVPNGLANATRADLHRGIGGIIFTPFRPADYTLGTASRPLMARTDSMPKFLFAAGFARSQVLYADTTENLKLLGDGIDIFGLNPLDAKAKAIGVSAVARDLLTLDVNQQAGHDLISLNLKRLKNLREHNIINKPLEKLQADGQDHLDSARDDRDHGLGRHAAAHLLIANVLGDRVHQPLRDSIDDLVKAVVILLSLSLPFSFVMERLLFGARSIYNQVSGFLAIFIVTFMILYFTHPAFSLAEAPVIIFLAFIILLLSVFVIYVVLSKFKYELRAMQGLSSKAHGGQQETGTALAAIAIGISGMRNRPLKTTLTATTVALLTFTILVFASFSSSLGVVQSYLGPSQGLHRIEFHSQSFLSMPSRLIDSLASLYGDHYQVFSRAASFRDPTQGAYKDEVSNVVMNPASLVMQSLEGVLVLDPREVELPNALDPIFSPLAAPVSPAAGSPAAANGQPALPPIMLSPLICNKLNIATGDVVVMRGQRFRLAGIFDAAKLKLLENIDGTRMVPPNFDATFKANGSHTENSDTLQSTFRELDVNNFVFSSPDLVAITTFAGMVNLGAQTNFVTLYPKAGVNVDADCPEIAEWLQGPVSASSDSGANRYFFTQKVEGSGIMEVLVPLLLGGLIIFSSLLGSIVDRQKEIFTYSALGLAPPDVATLFFAESAVFAVIGGMGGYLISQLVVKVLTLLASYGIASVPDVNFSSMSSIVTILIVMVTVMLSTIYPALMAGRSANPGVARKWRMPKPEGDVMRFTFPFTVSAESIAGILAFIREHFDNHGDASLGAFAARDVTVFARPRADGQREMGITAEIALAPFDLGVYQRFTMTTKASDIVGIDEVVVDLVRLNGSSGTWVRGNRAFIDDLREQFLRWRSLPVDSVEHYHALADGVIGAAHG